MKADQEINICTQPPNVQFEIDDLEETWNFSYPFDYIHCLMMTGAFRDWTTFYRQAFELVLPPPREQVTSLGAVGDKAMDGSHGY